jgi:hypothetical protein
MIYKMSTLQQTNHHCCLSEGNGASARECRDCKKAIEKSKQFCAECKKSRRKMQRRENSRNQRIKRKKASGWTLKRIKPLLLPDGKIDRKKCTLCSEWKTLRFFDKRKDTASGVRSFCKQCESVRSKKYKNKKHFTRIAFCENELCRISFEPKWHKKYCSEGCCNQVELAKARIKNQSIHVVDQIICCNCKKEKPIAQFASNNDVSMLKKKPRSCNDCKAEARKKSEKKQRKRRSQKPHVKIVNNLRKRLKDILKAANAANQRTSQMIGCSGHQLKMHLQKQFKKGMTWDNYGTRWHIDHILPCASFDHTDKEQVKKCWHYSNLRPLDATDNITKADTIITCQPELLLCF